MLCYVCGLPLVLTLMRLVRLAVLQQANNSSALPSDRSSRRAPLDRDPHAQHSASVTLSLRPGPDSLGCGLTALSLRDKVRIQAYAQCLHAASNLQSSSLQMPYPDPTTDYGTGTCWPLSHHQFHLVPRKESDGTRNLVRAQEDFADSLTYLPNSSMRMHLEA